MAGVTGPWQEFRNTGVLGAAGVEALYEIVRKVVAFKNLPAPDGMTAWTSDALIEAAHDIFAHRKGPERLLSLANRSTDEESFRAQLFTLVSNDLASSNRTTERGKLHERLRDVVAGMADIETAGKQIRLAGLGDGGRSARFDQLVAAASKVAQVVPAWNPLSTHTPPIADRDSLEEMIRAVLEAATSWMAMGDLTAVLAVRLGVHDAPVHRDDEGWERIAPVSYADPAAQVGTFDAAARLLGMLTLKEQMVLPYLDDSTTEIAKATGLGRTTAYKAADLARFKVRQFLEGDPDAAVTLGAAVERVRVRWDPM
ncbi:hypothetical protein acdb102_21570 [Acidothermaceae bacterium B102]|nr:hypothetical protein acdb102_21570 [Acidothermaceae bacterium B102]